MLSLRKYYLQNASNATTVTDPTIITCNSVGVPNFSKSQVVNSEYGHPSASSTVPCYKTEDVVQALGPETFQLIQNQRVELPEPWKRCVANASGTVDIYVEELGLFARIVNWVCESELLKKYHALNVECAVLKQTLEIHDADRALSNRQRVVSSIQDANIAANLTQTYQNEMLLKTLQYENDLASAALESSTCRMRKLHAEQQRQLMSKLLDSERERFALTLNAMRSKCKKYHVNRPKKDSGKSSEPMDFTESDESRPTNGFGNSLERTTHRLFRMSENTEFSTYPVIVLMYDPFVNVYVIRYLNRAEYSTHMQAQKELIDQYRCDCGIVAQMVDDTDNRVEGCKIYENAETATNVANVARVRQQSNHEGAVVTNSSTCASHNVVRKPTMFVGRTRGAAGGETRSFERINDGRCLQVGETAANVAGSKTVVGLAHKNSALKITRNETFVDILRKIQDSECIQIGYGFVTKYPAFFWSKFVSDNFETMFGLQNLSEFGDFRKFRLLSERMIRVKYEFYANQKTANLNNARRQSSRCLQTTYPDYDRFNDANFVDVDDCVRRCFSKSARNVHDLLVRAID